jgi:hypothetical protein
MATAFVVTMMIGSPAALAQESGCTYDTQCKGDRICEKGVCVSPTLPQNFPAGSTGRELGGSRVIKTTREDCELRGGVHRPTNDPKGGDLVRCALPRK